MAIRKVEAWKLKLSQAGAIFHPFIRSYSNSKSQKVPGKFNQTKKQHLMGGKAHNRDIITSDQQ